MRVRIYQVDMNRDQHQLVFRGHEVFQKKYGDRIPAELYREVFDGDMTVDDPEQVFAVFNASRPKGYTGWSLSVSDVVEFVSEGKFYFCDYIGFKPVRFASEGKEGSV